MGPNLHKVGGAEPPVCHAHLLAVETGGEGALEKPEAVIAEVSFRATHISSLMEAMFKEASEKDWWEKDEP
jgi:hypothetical protein